MGGVGAEWASCILNAKANNLVAATNGADEIPSIIVAAKSGDDSSVTTAGGNKHEKTKKIKYYLER